MIRIRVVPAVLIGVSLLALTACGGDETPAASAPAATTAAAADPAATAAAAEPAGAPAPSDKKLCENAEKAGKDMKAELFKALQAANGEMSDAETQKILGKLATELDKVAAASDSKVGTAIKDFATRANEAASAANWETAADDPAYEKAGKDLTAACKAVGVKVTY